MRFPDLIALVLVIVGAANWMLVGLLEFDLVATLVGEEFGAVNIASRAVYMLVGLAGIYLLSQIPRYAGADARMTTTQE
ncbi:hypothetical protein BH23CHL2_BH23CHL2_22940 [soil metagenome]